MHGYGLGIGRDRFGGLGIALVEVAGRVELPFGARAIP